MRADLKRSLGRVLTVAGSAGLVGTLLWADQGELAVAAALLVGGVGLFLVRAQLDGLVDIVAPVSRAGAAGLKRAPAAVRYRPDMQAVRAVALAVLLLAAVVGLQIAPFVGLLSTHTDHAGVATAEIENASYSSKLDISSQTGNPTGVAYNDDGTKLFVAGLQNDNVYEYSLSTAYDISSASFTQSRDVSTNSGDVQGVAFSGDGTKMFIADGNDNEVDQYSLSTAFDISTATYQNSRSNDVADLDGVEFADDGKKMYLISNSLENIYEYDLSTAYDVTSASLTREADVSAKNSGLHEVRISTDGTKLFTLDGADGDVYEYDLSTSYDTSTKSYQNTKDLSSESSSTYGLGFGDSGSTMVVTGSSNENIYEYDTDLSGFTSASGSALSGTVTDADGNAIENASVEAANASTGSIEATTTTDGAGAYEMTVADGDYEVTASASGFSARTKSVTVSGDTTLNFTLSSDTTVTDPDPPDGATVSEPPVQLSVLANTSNDSVQSIDVEFYKQDNGTFDPENDTQIGSRTVEPGERATVTWDPEPGTYRWYAIGTADSGATDVGGLYRLGIGEADIVDGSEEPPDGAVVRPTDNVELAVDVRVDDNATVEFYDYETGNPSTDPLIGSQAVDSSSSTASTRWDSSERDASEEWYARLSDSTGTRDTAGAFAFGAGGQVVARDAETGEVIDDRTVRFDTTYPGGSKTFDRVPANLNLSKVNAEPGDRIRIDVRAQDYYERTIEVSGKQSDADIYLEPGANWSYNPSSDDPDDSASVEDDPDRFISRFKLKDQTGRYPASNTTLTVKADVDGDGQTDLVHRSSFGAANRVDVRVKRDRRYQLSVENDAGDSRGLGGWTATQPDTTTLTISRVTEDIEIDQGYGIDAVVQGGTLKIYYRDYETRAETLSFEVREYPDGPYLENRTLTDVENATITIALNESQAEKTWQVDYEGSRVGVEAANISGQVTTGASGRVPLPVGSDVLMAGALVILAIVGALFTGPLSAIGSVGMVGVASVLYFIGWLPINAAALWVAAIVAVGSVLRSGGGRLG